LAIDEKFNFFHCSATMVTSGKSRTDVISPAFSRFSPPVLLPPDSERVHDSGTGYLVSHATETALHAAGPHLRTPFGRSCARKWLSLEGWFFGVHMDSAVRDKAWANRRWLPGWCNCC
jgi:hypothetical protein